MIEILREKQQQLTARAAELDGLIAATEQQAQAVAAAANADIEAIGKRAVGYAEELAGVRHSVKTLELLAEAAQAAADQERMTRLLKHHELPNGADQSNSHAAHAVLVLPPSGGSDDSMDFTATSRPWKPSDAPSDSEETP